MTLEDLHALHTSTPWSDIDDDALRSMHLDAHQAYSDSPLCEIARRHHLITQEMLERNLDHPHHDELDVLTGPELPEADDAEANTDATPHSHGIMLAFEIPREISQAIAHEGGEAPEELHLTLVYLGHMDDWTEDQLKQLPGVVSVYAANSKPMRGCISGMGRFAGSSATDSRDVLYHSVDVPELPAWRQGLVDWLEDAGFTQPSEHGYTPHVTVKYLSPDEPCELGAQQSHPVEFGELLCKIGEQRYRFPLASQQALRPQTWADRLVAHQEKVHESRTGVLSANVRRSPAADDAGVRLPHDAGGRVVHDAPATPEDAIGDRTFSGLYLHAAEASEPIIYGVLLVPDEPDLDGDVFSQDVIAKACAEYSAKLEADEQHRFANSELEVADSFLAPAGYAIDGHPVKPGSWVIGIRSGDPDVIAKVERGDYRGLSMEGSAMVRERRANMPKTFCTPVGN